MIDICKICNEKHDLRTHLKVHSITSKEYYDRFIKKPDPVVQPVKPKPQPKPSPQPQPEQPKKKKGLFGWLFG